MRIPFAVDLNIGTDIIAFRRLLKPHGSPTHLRRIALRFMHPAELNDLDRRFPEWRALEKASPSDQARVCVHIAGRWAAKEAAKKAWGATLISFKDLRVETRSDGQVQVICQSYCDASDGQRDPCREGANLEQAAKLSISHDGDYAIATVIATPLHSDIIAELIRRKEAAASKVTGIK